MATAAIYFDDIEKFGIWPETYQWVYEKGWLDNFIQGVLASPHDSHPALPGLSCRRENAGRSISPHHFLYRNERMDASRPARQCLCRTLCGRRRRQAGMRATRRFCAVASGKIFFRVILNPTGCTNACWVFRARLSIAAGAATMRKR